MQITMTVFVHSKKKFFFSCIFRLFLFFIDCLIFIYQIIFTFLLIFLFFILFFIIFVFHLLIYLFLFYFQFWQQWVTIILPSLQETKKLHCEAKKKELE